MIVTSVHGEFSIARTGAFICVITLNRNFENTMKPPLFSYHDPDAAQRLRAGKERRQ